MRTFWYASSVFFGVLWVLGLLAGKVEPGDYAASIAFWALARTEK